MKHLHKTLLSLLLLCLLGAAGKGYGQEESLKTDKRYKGLVAAWNFDSNLNELLEGKPLKFQGQAPAYSPDRNYEPGKALVVNGKTFFSEIYKSLPTGNQPRTITFWLRVKGKKAADFSVIKMGNQSSPYGEVKLATLDNQKLRLSFEPPENDVTKYCDFNSGISNGSWSHIAITYRGKINTYLDGKEIQNNTNSGLSNIDTADGRFSIGFESDTSADEGLLCVDDIRIFNTSLTSRGIGQIYELEKSTLTILDSDGEGLSDEAEIFIYDTNPLLADSDGDGMDDAEELYSKYKVVYGHYNWHEAKNEAADRGGYLATITSKHEEDLIGKYLLSENDSYIPSLHLGGTDEKQEGDWEWVTGEPWIYTNWLKHIGSNTPKAPNNQRDEEHYLQIRGSIAYTNEEGWDSSNANLAFSAHLQRNDATVITDKWLSHSAVGYLLEKSEIQFDPNNPDTNGNGIKDGDEESKDLFVLKNVYEVTAQNKNELPKLPEGYLHYKVVIPNGTVVIESEAFLNEPIIALDIPNSVTEIRSSAFEGTKIRSLIIPDSVVKIEENAFFNSNLSSVKLSASMKLIDVGCFARNALTSIDIPDSVKKIDSNAFNENFALQHIKLSENIETIGQLAFAKTAVTQMLFPASLKSIDHFAFTESLLLKSVVFNGPVEKIGTEAFRYSAIREVDIPNPKVTIASSFPVGTKINKLIKLEFERVVAGSPVNFSFFSERRKSYVVEFSSDLKEWGELESIKGNGKSIEFTDTREALFQKQYYRVKVGD